MIEPADTAVSTATETTSKGETRPDQEPAEPKYVVMFRANRDQPRWFESPYFSHAVAGVIALLEGAVQQTEGGALGAVYDLRIYHMDGKNPGEKHLVTSIRIENRDKWHPAGHGPRIDEIPIEAVTGEAV